MLLNQTIRLFLDGIGRREEYEFYLNKFQSAGTACFALLVPDLQSLDQGAEAFAFDLHFLLRLGLRPAVVLCGTDAENKWALLSGNPLFGRTEFPMVGVADGQVPVFVDPDFQCLESLKEKVPNSGPEPTGERGSVNAGQRPMGVATRVHFIRAAGGFDVDYYYTQKENGLELTSEERALVDVASALLEARPGTHISITTPMNLLEEIFTVKGAGTVFRKGSEIVSPVFQTLEPVARDALKSKLLGLLKESFKKEPLPNAVDQVTQVYLEENYRGGVLLEEQPEGLYLSKFAVGPEARGEGLAQELWDAVCENHPVFFWRSHAGNSVNQWYDRQADGYYTAGEWIVFWRGMSAESIPGIIAFCQSRTSDFS